LDRGLVDHNYVDEATGHTTMHRAAAFGALKVIKMLHTRGASLDVKNKRNMTPLQAAEDIGEPKAAKLLQLLVAGKSGNDVVSEDDDED